MTYEELTSFNGMYDYAKDEIGIDEKVLDFALHYLTGSDTEILNELVHFYHGSHSVLDWYMSYEFPYFDILEQTDFLLPLIGEDAIAEMAEMLSKYEPNTEEFRKKFDRCVKDTADFLWNGYEIEITNKSLARILNELIVSYIPD